MQCYRPVRLVKRFGDSDFAGELFVPCGKCYACLYNKQQDWINRMKEEEKHSGQCFFITLTYDDVFLPYMYTNTFGGYSQNYSVAYPNKADDYPTLVKSDVQKFMKRLRKHIKTRFFLCGEYGSHTIRPHYHVCLFPQSDYSQGFIDDIIRKCWTLGFVTVSLLNESRMAYCAKYLVKGGKYPEHSVKPFCLMSNKPGIGASYIDMQTYNYHLTHPFLVKPGGFRQRMPRYWKTKMSLTNDGVVSDAMELEYLKTHDSLEGFADWRKIHVEAFELRVETRINKDKL